VGVRACERHEKTYQLPRNLRWRYLKENKPLFCNETSNSQVRITMHKTYQHTMGKCDSTKQELDWLKIQHREHFCNQVSNSDTSIYLKHIVEYYNRWNTKYIQNFRCETPSKEDHFIILEMTGK